ncbi:M3 family oligoendopeptidase [Acholeplasma laidlawii]|uniref:Oligoendopeptidase F, M3B family n=1 Tax=Acholeplasma laidlawii (strain PG-8A) TaxID=441768 RepID=A9NEG5_ACHLI|nr:M3 family oligoendopeptidase [Acholeplasma laidlawii]ABX80745.1 oligoendopeptidase F, M3B family [Acholeplasma laidlawii PG-8A]RED19837.1 M3 family oligoendopeptidase [Acholeplasma laidlawii]SQH56348.1 oligoendopeptidase, M3 family [Acholeplasma laidlawii]
MKFNEYTYERPNLEDLKSKLETLTKDLTEAQDAKEALSVVKLYHKIMDNVDTQMQLVLIRHSIDTSNTFYDDEQAFVDNAAPLIESSAVKFTNALLSSKFRSELEASLGELLFKKAELSNKTFNDEVIGDLQLENKYTTEYVKIRSSAQIAFEGKVYNLSQMAPFTTHKDRKIRKEAAKAVSNWYKEKESAFDEVYDNLVKVRTTIATKLGYENFIQLGYDRLKRVDYHAEDVQSYRKQIAEKIVPVVSDLMKRRQKRLDLDKMMSYDLGLTFLNGNPEPKGDRAWQVDQAIKMYDELSPETSKFFRFLVDSELLDLDSKANKEGGGYCTYIPDYEAPFIFANFNGTSGDVDVLTHEAGHAFQVYMSKDLIPEYRWPGYEAAEIHSMSMEFLAWPYMELFFKEDTDKYKFAHLSGGLEFLPYGALVDHFQHEVYGNPNMTPKMRKDTWKKLEKIYQPWKIYEELDPVGEGLFWFRQGHIFQDPFYYIDYTLAQVLAFDFWGHNQKDPKKTWERYLELCKMGGQYSFVRLLNEAKLPNPFIDGTIEEILKPVNAYLSSIDDSKF